MESRAYSCLARILATAVLTLLLISNEAFGSRYFDPNEVLKAPTGSGAIWYVDGTNGSDSSNGKSESTAFKTIQKALYRYGSLAAGDTVLIKAGVYRERISITQKGTAEKRITIGPYGNGEVVVDCSNPVTGWTIYSGKIYKVNPTFKVRAVVLDKVPLLPESSLAALTPTSLGGFYYDNTTLYLRMPDGLDPSAHDIGVVIDDAYQDGIFFNNVDYITIYGITCRFAGGHGITILGNYNRVEKCKLQFNGKCGVNLYTYSTTPTTNVEIIKNDVYHNCMRNWPRGLYKWGGWPAGIVSNGTSNVLYQGNVSHRNGGEGMLAYAGAGGTTIRDNIVYDNWSVNIYIDNQKNGRIENNFVYSYEIDPNDLYGNQDPDPSDNRNLRRLRPEGIMTADENYSLTPPANLENMTIANNIILNCRRGITHYGQATGSGLKYVKVVNNTVIVPDAVGTGEDYAGISIPYNNGNNIGSVYTNNLIYGRNPSTYLLYGGTDPAGVADNFKGISMSNNLWYHSGRPAAFHWGRDYNLTWDYTYAQWKALPGAAHSAGDQNADPKLVNPYSWIATDKRPSDVSSPAIDHGIPSDTAVDFRYGARPFASGFDMGAFEYGAVPTPMNFRIQNP